LDWAEDYYRTQVRPVLTPLASIQPTPSPATQQSLNLIVRLEMQKGQELLKHGVVQIPRILPRMVKLPRSDAAGLRLFEPAYRHHLADLFQGTKILGYWPFRVTRTASGTLMKKKARTAQSGRERIAQPAQRRCRAVGGG